MAENTLQTIIKSFFTTAANRVNLTSGETLETSLGKISKWFSDLGTAAFKNIPASGNASSSEVVLGNDTRLSDSRTPTSHNQDSSTINAMTGYTKPSSTSAIATTDTLNEAIGKLEKGLESSGGGSDLAIGSLSSATKIRLTFKESTCDYVVQGQIVHNAGSSAGLFYPPYEAAGTQSGGHLGTFAPGTINSSYYTYYVGVFATYQISAMSNKQVVMTVPSTQYMVFRSIHIPQATLKQISKVERYSGSTWTTIYTE